MEERISERIEEIEEILEEIENWLPDELEEYERNIMMKKASERNFELISEYIIDVALYFIKSKGFRAPKSDESTFQILAENKIISEELCEKMIELRGMRNFIAHRYGEIDNSKVFHALKEQLRADVEEFLNSIKE